MKKVLGMLLAVLLLAGTGLAASAETLQEKLFGLTGEKMWAYVYGFSDDDGAWADGEDRILRVDAPFFVCTLAVPDGDVPRDSYEATGVAVTLDEHSFDDVTEYNTDAYGYLTGIVRPVSVAIVGGVFWGEVIDVNHETVTMKALADSELAKMGTEVQLPINDESVARVFTEDGYSVQQGNLEDFLKPGMTCDITYDPDSLTVFYMAQGNG